MAGLALSLLIFAVAAVAILAGGVRLIGVAEAVARVTGLGGALVGAVLLGMITSISGVITSVAAAWEGYAELSASNAIGGIAAQTVFLVLADAFYRRANLEHAAASLQNLISGTLLVILLATVVLTALTPPVTFLSIHPASIALPAIYLYGLRIAEDAGRNPMWGPKRTAETEGEDKGDSHPDDPPLPRLLLMMALLAVVVGGGGYAVAITGIDIARQTGIGQGLVGALFTAVATSTPELVTTIAAVRRGAVTLAVGGILGGNSFDVLFLAFSDIAYRDGSLYHAIPADQRFLVLLTLAMSAVLILGLLRRERRGPANIGTEGVAIIALYLGGMVLLSTGQ